MKKNLICCSFLLLNSITAFSQHAGHVTALRDTVCQGTITTLIVVNNSDSIIQWQSSLNNSAFRNIKGANSSMYKTSPMLETTWFRVLLSNGSDSAFSDTLKIFVPPAITVNFTSQETGNNAHTFTFNSDSSEGDIARYHWDFGDGDTSSEKDPTHTYAEDSTFYVCLTAYDTYNDCSYTFCRYIQFDEDPFCPCGQLYLPDVPYGGPCLPCNPLGGVPMVPADNYWLIYPSPFSGQLNLIAKQNNNTVRQIEIYNLLGQRVFEKSTGANPNSFYKLDVSSLDDGIYYMKIKTIATDYIQKIVKE